MQDENIQHIYASPFLRTVQTAHQVADVLSVPVRVEYGLSEGLLASELPESDQTALIIGDREDLQLPDARRQQSNASCDTEHLL